MSKEKLKNSTKLLAVIFLDLIPSVLIMMVIITCSRYFIGQKRNAFDFIFQSDYYLRISVVMTMIYCFFTLVFYFMKIEIPDTDVKGYRKFIREKIFNG